MSTVTGVSEAEGNHVVQKQRVAQQRSRAAVTALIVPLMFNPCFASAMHFPSVSETISTCILALSFGTVNLIV